MLPRSNTVKKYTFGTLQVVLDIPYFEADSGKKKVDTTGFSVWQASEVLCTYVVNNNDKIPSGPCIELGAGLGLCGIALAKLGRDVVCTDSNAKVLELARSGACSNGVQDSLGVFELSWGDQSAAEALKRQLGQRPALVVGADLVYDEALIPALVETIAYLGADMTLLSMKPRHFGSEFDLCEELLSLADAAYDKGLRVQKLHQEGDTIWDCVQVQRVHTG
jgi:hypothetical protein